MFLLSYTYFQYIKPCNIYSILSLFLGFHRASSLPVAFINQLMHSIITVIDVKILLYKSLKDRH